MSQEKNRDVIIQMYICIITSLFWMHIYMYWVWAGMYWMAHTHMYAHVMTRHDICIHGCVCHDMCIHVCVCHDVCLHGCVGHDMCLHVTK